MKPSRAKPAGDSKMKRKAYEKELAQAAGRAVPSAGLGQDTRVCGSSSCSKAATPPARAAPSRRSPNASARASSGSSPCRRRPTAKRRRCSCSATSSNFRPPARSSSSTAAGTTAPASNTSWDLSARTSTERFLELCPEIEKYIVDGGIILHQDSGSRSGRRSRSGAFEARIDDPLRQWKLSPMDVESYTALVRLFEGARPDAEGDRQQTRAVVHRALG